jgi:hypothetical protein
MLSRAQLLLLFAVGLVACGGDPPPEAQSSKSSDNVEVKMEAVPVASAAAEPSPVATAPSTSGSGAPPIDPAEDPNIGGPQEPFVEKAVSPVRPRIRACYKKAAAASPGLVGSITFDTTIAKDGKVSSARFVKKDGFTNDDFVGCLTSAVKSMQFAPDRKTQVVAFTFGASSGADAGARH